MKLINLAIKHCKKIVSIALIMLILIVPGKSFANDEYKIDDIQRNELIKQSQVVNWESFDNILDHKSNFIIIDYYTGYYIVCSRMGGGKHADIEPVNQESNDNIKKIMDSGRGGKRRPVIVMLENGESYLGSSFMVGHAGVDDQPYLKVLDKRSNGYGKGENYDKVKGNGMDGHMCLFVEGCKNHYDGKENKDHNNNLKFLKERKEISNGDIKRENEINKNN